LVAVAITACPPAATVEPPRPPLVASASASRPDPEIARAAVCHERALRFGEWLRGVDASGWPLALVDDGGRLVQRAGPALDEPAPVIHLTAVEQALEGVRVPDLVALGTELTALLELRKQTMESSPFIANPRVYLAVDGDVRWERVVTALERIDHSGIERVTFVFADSTREVASLPASMIDADIAKLASASPKRRQQILAELLAFVYQECPSALKIISQFGHEVAEMRQALVAELPKAIEVCRCAPDDASAHALHWALFGNSRPGSGITVSIAAPQASKRVVKAQAGASWQDAHGLLLSLVDGGASETVGFEVEVAPAPEEDDKKKGGGKRPPPPGPKKP
jgi:hypothetical protein